jgi:23S rRNA pseudouridine1911/1915/1917 synthase
MSPGPPVMAPRDLSQPLREVVYRVADNDTGQRLDAWIKGRVTWRSRSDIQRRIAEGRVLVDGRTARKNDRVQAGQEVKVLVDEGPATQVVPVDDIPLVVLLEDPWLIALDKAPGTVVHPVGRHVMDTIVNALHVRHHRGEGIPGAEPPMIVHRLDRDTSGVLVLAKDEEARKALGRDFETRRVQKTYLAVVTGIVEPDQGTIDLAIGPDPEGEIRLKVACVPDGRPSRTDFEVLRRGAGITLLRARPHTGRQHQIRVHLSTIGHPILGDRLYGHPGPVRVRDLDPGAQDPDRVLLDRQALHAETLRFRHPRTGDDVFLEAPLPLDLRSLV